MDESYEACGQCEGDGCLGPNPTEDQCPRCGGSGCEPPEEAPYEDPYAEAGYQ